MQYLHTMIRATDLQATLTFFCDHLGDSIHSGCFTTADPMMEQPLNGSLKILPLGLNT